MIRWLGPLGRVWAPAIMPLHYFVLSMVVSLGFCMPIIHLHYILWFNCAHYCMFYICGCEAHFVITILCVNSGLPCLGSGVRSVSRKRSYGVAEPPQQIEQVVSGMLSSASKSPRASYFDTGWRTTQVLPREAQLTRQIGAQRVTMTKRIIFIISLHVHRTPKMIMVVQTVQRLRQTMHRISCTLSRIDHSVKSPELIITCTIPIQSIIEPLSLLEKVLVRVAYTEDSNVIMMVPGGASQMRGSEFF